MFGDDTSVMLWTILMYPIEDIVPTGDATVVNAILGGYVDHLYPPH